MLSLKLKLKHVTPTKLRSFLSSSSYSSLSHRNHVALSFKSWFKSRHNTITNTNPNPIINRIFQILSSPSHRHQNADVFHSQLSLLRLPLSESFVLSVLRHGSSTGEVLSCLKFFDWAGRQPHFHHTRATFASIFRILSRAGLRPLVLDFLRSFRGRRYAHRVRFNDTLVIGYAIAGKPDIALHLFARMRFRGLDLDSFAYHVFLNALVEECYFDAFDVVFRQIRVKGFENCFTNVVLVKSLCKRGRLDEAEGYVGGLVRSGKSLHGCEVSFLVGALCERKWFDRAERLVREVGGCGLVSMENAYGAWMRGLVQGGRLDEALEFFKAKKDSEGYVPALERYNSLLCRLLRENRLGDAYDLLVDMCETCIQPDMVTMNAVLCFFCKAGMVDVALELYNSRSEYGLSPNHMAFKYLIFTLCWDGSLKEAYSVFKSSLDHGYFPDRQTFSKLASALCRECKIGEMKELLHLALSRNFMPNASTYDRFIKALCRAGRVDEGYLIHGEINSATARVSYVKMIMGFLKSNRGDIAARLLIEMQAKGHKLTRPLCRAVLCSLLDADNPRAQFYSLLEILSQNEPHREIYNCFIDGAGHAKKAELAREVFELMQRNGIKPDMSSQILMLKGYLKSGRISDALNFFNSLRSRGMVNRKLYNSLIVGLCKSNKADIAHDILFEMIKAGLNPSIECYEDLVQQLCSLNRYHEAINLVNVYEKMGRRLTSFLGNVLLFHSLVSQEVYNTCVRLRGVKEGEFSGSSMLTMIIGAFSGCLKADHSIEELEELIAKCFPVDIYTYNLLLKKVSKSDMDQACELFNRIFQRGYVPNRWTYDIMVHGFSKHGMKDDAKRWVEEMFRKGFYPTESTARIFI